MTSLCVEVVGLFIYQVLLSTHTVKDGNRDHWGCINVHISSPLPTGPDQPGRLRQIFRNHTRAQVSHQHDRALNYHFALCTFQTHTHTQAQDHYLALPNLTRTRIIIFFVLSTPAAQDHFPPGHTVKIIALSTIGSDPFLYLETLCVNMFSLCVCICDLCMYVGEVYKCISVFVYVYKLLDDLNFPRD